MLHKFITTSMSIMIASSCFAGLSIGDYQKPNTTYVINEYGNGNQLAYAKDIPLNIYLESIYAGYKVKFNQASNIPISINGKIPNNSVAILKYLAAKYSLNFTFDNEKHVITIEPNKNIPYLSYLDSLRQLNKYLIKNSSLSSNPQVEKSKSTQKALKNKITSKQELEKELKDAKRLGYKFRVAAPLRIKSDNNKNLINEVLAYNQKQNLIFDINRATKIVGIAENKKEAKALSQTQRGVFYVFAGKTMQSTIKHWASYENINVLWQAKKNFKIIQSATIFGTFASTNGVLATLLGSIENSAYPLKATFMKNDVLLIRPLRYSTIK